tara:strand:- start:9990 stop:10892 length:903 start_codon:yes stop_codon:yes gene_type:complete
VYVGTTSGYALPIYFMKKINTLVKDIYNLFKEEHGCKLSEKEQHKIISNCVSNIHNQLSQSVNGKDIHKKKLRMSNVGYPDRQLWYQFQDVEKEPLNDNDPIKFLYGHIIEELVFCLTALAGHKVTDVQKETILAGVKGHIDGRVDGVLVDVKSASPASYRKFKDRTLYKDDPFGYMDQLSSYATAEKAKEAGFLVMNKISGELCWMPLDELEITNTEKRIEYLKGMVKLKDAPPRCHPDVPEGKSGNYKLGMNCFYCAYKKDCWSDSNNGHGLRAFEYQKGIVYLTRVSRVPDVPEVKG